MCCYELHGSMRTKRKGEKLMVLKERDIFIVTSINFCITPSNLIPKQIIISKPTNFGVL